jgi:hypothetical protein
MKKVLCWIAAFVAVVAAVPTAAQSPAARSRSSSNGVRYFGPTEAESRYQSRPPSVGEAPAQLKYMSPRCSALNDALRTATARGLNYDTISKMRKDYQSECGEDEREASGRLAEEMRDRSMQKRQDKLSDDRERQRTAMQQEQCGESRRILIAKRARTDLTEGQKDDLQRFEANYRARC